MLTLCNLMNCSTPGLPVHHQLLELTQTHVHWVSDTIQPSHPLLSPSPLSFNLSHHQGLFQWVSSWSFKNWSWIGASASAWVLPMNIQDWFPLGWTGWISLQSRGLSRVFFNTKFKRLILWCSALFMAQLSYLYMTTGKIRALTVRIIVGKAMSLHFNMLSRLVIAFLSRSKRLLISWLVTICSDFGAPQNKVCHCFQCFPIYLPWSGGTGCHDLSWIFSNFFFHSPLNFHQEAL